MNGFASTLRSAARRSTLAALALLAVTCLLPAQAKKGGRTPELPAGAEALRVPEGNRVSMRVFAAGVQVYRWDATANRWAFVGPKALLFADSGCHGLFGTHGAGPIWTSNSGSYVKGAVVAGHIVDAKAIPWLLLRAVESDGPGPFAETTFVQRVNTTGGLAPARVGTPNEVVEIPYTAEYFFYRAQ
jgi:hypothetical protein